MVEGKDEYEVNEAADKCATRARSVMKQTELGESIGSAVGEGIGDSDDSGVIPVGTEGEMLVPSDGERWQDVVIETFRRGGTRRTDWSTRSRRLQPGSKQFLPGTRKVNGIKIALILDVSGS